jgi:hypothetical protein
MVAAVPKRQGLPTYLGLVNIGITIKGEATIFGVVCRSTQTKLITPNWNMIAQPKPHVGFDCPSEFQEVKK